MIIGHNHLPHACACATHTDLGGEPCSRKGAQPRPAPSNRKTQGSRHTFNPKMPEAHYSKDFSGWGLRDVKRLGASWCSSSRGRRASQAEEACGSNDKDGGGGAANRRRSSIGTTKAAVCKDGVYLGACGRRTSCRTPPDLAACALILAEFGPKALELARFREKGPKEKKESGCRRSSCRCRTSGSPPQGRTEADA